LLPIFASAFSTRFLRRYLLAGDRFNAEQAFRAGLVNEICVAAEMDDVIEKVIESFLQAGPGALAGAKTLLIELRKNS
jgi:methylglutaconyl-CoA hydratase